MYFEPNGNIYILRFVPLDNTYTNTFYWDNREQQIEYFQSKAKLMFTEQTYTRLQRGTLRVEQNAENLYDCNYLMFQNKDFGEQWFYAFIKNVEYLNNYTSEIAFELDVMQTWYWNYSLAQCFVLREHPLTDEVGDNLLGESYPQGEIVARGVDELLPIVTNRYSIVIAASSDPDTGESIAECTNGLLSGVHYEKIDVYTASEASINEAQNNFRDFIDKYISTNQLESILNVFAVPNPVNYDFFTFPDEDGITAQRNGTSFDITIDRPSDISGYTPKNNKLLTYPYTFFMIQAGNNTKVYRWEFFENTSQATFRVRGFLFPKPVVVLTPLNYLNAEENYHEEIILDDFPQIALSIDQFKVFLSQKLLPSLTTIGISALANTASATAIAATAVATGGASSVAAAGTAIGKTATTAAKVTGSVGEGIGTAAYRQGFSALTSQTDSLANLAGEAVSAAIQGPAARGTDTADVDFVRGIKTFMYSDMETRQANLRCLDDYFSMFGYTTNRIKVPNIGTRPYYNYVKLSTVNFNYTIGEDNYASSVPADSMSLIIAIYQKGITFWKSSATVGDYSVDNSPTNTEEGG